VLFAVAELLVHTHNTFITVSFVALDPQMWNDLPTDTLDTFENKVKTFLFDADSH